MSITALSFLLFLSTALVTCNPNPLAGSLTKRSARPGLALNANWDGTSYKCAPGSNPTTFDKFCCPDGYSLNTDANTFTSLICCPTGTDCRAEVLACPRCADSDWTYWDINGTNVPPELPFCCQNGWGPGQLNEPDPANVCTTGGNKWTDYLTASQCGGAAAATDSAATATATGSGATASMTGSGGASATKSATQTAATASSTPSAASGNGASSSVSLSGSSSFALFVVMLLPGVAMLIV
ncbi:hypothetical protein LTR84_001831 [Exophiala bonariae]|uniref:Uncharacterized protein n=1 Tax=Exophiala bonariae TaxID=1690606 RepID=A0AAV9NFG8_9EURO|nr:hypothetical protein LTR84_001831 [Exophiala bonariae]